MPLATKNNAIILKDGKLAENCGCCGGWYCYGECCCVIGCTVTITFLGQTFLISNANSWSSAINAGDLLRPMCPNNTFLFGPTFLEARLCCCEDLNCAFAGELWGCKTNYCNNSDNKKTIFVDVGLNHWQNAAFTDRACAIRWLFAMQCNQSGWGGVIASEPVCKVVDTSFCSSVSWACQPYIYPSLPSPTVSIACNN